MRNKHKNELFKIIQDSGIGLEKFSTREDLDNGIPAFFIEFSGTPFKFIVRTSPDSYESLDYSYTLYGPAYKMSEYGDIWNSISVIVANLEWWLNNHLSKYIEDQDQPDFWEEFKSRNKSFSFNKIEFDEKTNFSLDERAQIKLSLNELKLLIQTHIATDENSQQIVNARLDYLIEASERLNRFDWKSLVISTLISITLSLSLDTAKGKLLFELFKKVFTIVPQIAP